MPDVQRRAPTQAITARPYALAIAVLALLISMLICVPSMRFGIVPVVQTALPLAVIPLIVLTALQLWRRAFVAAALTASAASLCYYPAITGRAEPSCAAGPELRVFHANLLAGAADAASVANVIDAEAPDVISFVEATDDFMLRFDLEDAAGPYIHRSQAPGDNGPAGSVVLSKYPMTELEAPRASNPSHRTMQPAAEVTMPWGTVTVRAMHPYPPLGALRHSWDEVLRQSAAWVRDDVSGPVVLAGDFNATSAHPAFRELNAELVDVGSRRGWFHPPTWPATSPVPAWVGLDHVLTRDLRTETYQDFVISGTDHKALSVVLTTCQTGIQSSP